MKPKLGYVIVAVVPHRPPAALMASESGWSNTKEPAVFKSRPEAARALRETKTHYSSSSSLRFAVVPLRDWDRLRIQTVISAP